MSGSSLSSKDDSMSEIHVDVTERYYTDSKGKIKFEKPKQDALGKLFEKTVVSPTSANSKRPASQDPVKVPAKDEKRKKPDTYDFSFFNKEKGPKKVRKNTMEETKGKKNPNSPLGLMTLDLGPIANLELPPKSTYDEDFFDDLRSVTSYEAREERIKDIQKWRPWNPWQLFTFVTDITKQAISRLAKKKIISEENADLALRLRNLNLQLLKKEAEVIEIYPEFKLKDARFFRGCLDDYAKIIEDFPYLVETLGWETIYEYFKDCTEEDAKFLQRFARYQPDKILVRVIADLDRQTFTFATEFDKYRDIFFADGGEGVSFLD